MRTTPHGKTEYRFFVAHVVVNFTVIVVVAAGVVIRVVFVVTSG